MAKDLTTSATDRQNILNNPFAVAEIENAIGIKCIPFEGKRVVLLDQVAFFFGVNRRTIERLVSSHKEELARNGYDTLRANRLISFKEVVSQLDGTDIDVGTIARSSVLSVFDFRSFLNVAMLLTESDQAKSLRQAILEIVIDTLNVRAGGGTKYINQRDQEFLRAYYAGESYRKEFTDALRDFVNMGNYKYPMFTDKIYKFIFRERAQEYRKILELKKYDKTRETFYAEVVNIISSVEYGFADELKRKSSTRGRTLDSWEANTLFEEFSAQALWKPQLENARTIMASRDLAFRDALHLQLEEYIKPLHYEDFERFLGEQSQQFQKRLEDAKDVMKRLKDR